MAANYANRIERLKLRRKGINEIYAMDSADESRNILLEKSQQQESWESRASGKSATKYALGAMQEVDPVYTRVSYETGDRIKNQLSRRLEGKGITASFRLQGSVPLNIHIKGVSDVDLLAIDEEIFMSDKNGIKYSSYIPSSKNCVHVIRSLRNEIEDSLASAFPAATIHTDNAKSVKITGGSLARDVDVVPAIWWNNAKYQSSDREVDRGVTILNKKTAELIYNTPFLHVELITSRCDLTFGGLRKSIRMLKNIKADAEAESIQIGLSSFDITSIMYHANLNNLQQGRYYELAILVETQRWLDWLWHNYEAAQKLDVPDETRKIFDNAEKKNELAKLSLQVDKLVLAVANEFNRISNNDIVDDNIRNYVSKSSA
ncbi:hypothetical protein KU74_17450 [Pectobacterium brasiliense]|uniref:cGAS/DncV-like nucleotidyltransferase C-terminal helical domain-containing protein n=1 Tax=Pectobacterium brasiliense TaxID=180957 RepID=A0A0M2EZR1_9GAMM|nr:hypothetical protein [Pectobacterium brasiliense]KGA32478.1 hypothetical protein KU74_17450 [Pectobacterium brasiliense]